MTEEMSEIPGFVQLHTQDLLRKITAEKDRLIFQAITEKVVKTGLINKPLKLEEEIKRRFPRIMQETREDGSTHYYWNDGSEGGLRLISFYRNDIEQDFTEAYKFTAGFRYC